jgi:hypothetical protein
MRDRVSLAEVVAAAAITAGAIWLHSIAAASAGALWRDEANTLALSTYGGVRDIWANLQLDSFPILWPLLVRFYARAFGSMNDSAFRVVGFFTGLAVVAALWLNAIVFRYRTPLVSLALFALCPSVIKWGDSLRAYGLGIAIVLCAAALVWRFIQYPTLNRFAVAVIAATLSVHLLYYNAVLILAFVMAGIAVCVRRRDWQRGKKVLVIGLIPAATMVPYVAVIRAAADWSPLVQIPDYSFAWFIAKLNQTLAPAGTWALAVWVAGMAVAIVIGVKYLADHRTRDIERSTDADAVLFALVSLVVGSLGSYLFLDALSYVTQPWYYLTLIAIVAVSMDIVFGVVAVKSLARTMKVALALAVALATLPVAGRTLRTQLTNVNSVASALERIATPRDLVVVTPWHFGVSFNRYYHGGAPWTTLPVVEFHEFHRYDLVKLAMEQPNQLAPISTALARARMTLAAGGKVYIAGIPGMSSSSGHVKLLGKAPSSDGRWPEPEYQKQWTEAFAEYLKRHSHLAVVIRGRSRRTSHYEDMTLVAAEGWRP